MKKIYFLSIAFCLVEMTLLAQTSSSPCLMLDNPIKSSRISVNKSGPVTQSMNPCGNFYVNVFFHFIRDDNGATGQAVGNVNQYMNVLNGAYNAHGVFFINKGFDEIRNSSISGTNFWFSFDGATFNSYSTINSHSDAINVYIFREDSFFSEWNSH